MVVAVGAGAWALVDHNNKQALNARYAELSQELVTETTVMVDGSAALLGIAGEHELAEPVQTSIEATAEDSENLLNGLVDDGLIVVDGFKDLAATSPSIFLSQVTVSDKTGSQSDDSSQSGAAQSGGNHAATVDFVVMGEELGYGTTGPEEVQSGSAQSGSEAQSGDTPPSADLSTWTIEAGTLDQQATSSDLEGLEQRLGAIQAQNEVIETVAIETVTDTYTELLTAAQEGYATQSKALDEVLATAEKTLTDSKDKVADNKTREALTKAIDAAKPIAKKTSDSSDLVSELTEATAEKKSTTDSLNKAIKSVTESQAAKKKADEEAAAKAAAEAAAAYSYVEPSYSDYDSGYGDYSGGGYSNGGGYQAPAPAAPSGGGGGR